MKIINILDDAEVIPFWEWESVKIELLRYKKLIVIYFNQK